MLSWSSSSEHLGWFRRGLCLVLLAVMLRWQGLSQVGALGAGISVNKVEFVGSAALSVAHAGGRPSPCSSLAPPWWRTCEVSGAGSVNKCKLFLQSELDATFFLLAGRGGEGEEKLGVGHCSVGRRGRLDVRLRSSEAVHLRSSSMTVESAAVILGQQQPLRVVMCWRHHGLFFLQAKEVPRWRIFDLCAASHADGGPSGMFPGVAGGGRCSGSCSGREEGLDGFPNFHFKVLLEKSEDSSVNPVWIWVLFVIVPAD